MRDDELRFVPSPPPPPSEEGVRLAPPPPPAPDVPEIGAAADEISVAREEAVASQAAYSPAYSSPATPNNKTGIIVVVMLVCLALLGGGGYYGYQWANGNGKLDLSDGGVYYGPYKWRQPAGRGVVSYNDGRRYEGMFSGGNVGGALVLTSKEGRYEGNFVDGQLQGEGKYWSSDGTKTYAGAFKDGKFQGKGTLSMKDGSKYTGDFVNGLFEGKGEYTDGRGGKITGDFKAGQPSKVTRIPLNGRSYFEETYQNGQVVESKRIPGLAATNIRTRNTTGSKVALSDWTNSFPWAAARFISFEVTLTNTMPNPQRGKLGIRYIEPGGILSQSSSSPAGLSFAFDVDVQTEKTVAEGWGNGNAPTLKRGQWTIQLMWDDQKIGETNFTIY